jgi:hypothetical protein
MEKVFTAGGDSVQRAERCGHVYGKDREELKVERKNSQTQS